MDTEGMIVRVGEQAFELRTRDWITEVWTESRRVGRVGWIDGRAIDLERSLSVQLLDAVENAFDRDRTDDSETWDPSGGPTVV